MVSKAKVTKIIDENLAEIEVTRKSACGDNCATCSGCDKPNYIAISIAKNPKGAKVGDVVNVESKASYVLKGAAYIYMLPLILFFIGYLVPSAFTENESVKNGIGFIGFCLGIFLAGLYSKRMQKKNEINLEII